MTRNNIKWKKGLVPVKGEHYINQEKMCIAGM
jgi:hypothetical protein